MITNKRSQELLMLATTGNPLNKNATEELEKFYSCQAILRNPPTPNFVKQIPTNTLKTSTNTHKNKNQLLKKLIFLRTLLYQCNLS